MEYKDFWTLVYNVQDDLKIKEAVRELHPIKVEEVILHLSHEMIRLKGENEQMKMMIPPVQISRVSYRVDCICLDRLPDCFLMHE